MTLQKPIFQRRISRRGFLAAGAFAAAGMTLYASEFERHRLEVSHVGLRLPNLPPGFEGMRIAQLSDIHMDEYTEPAFLRRVIQEVDHLRPDAVFLTGDFVSDGPFPLAVSRRAAAQCAAILRELSCPNLYAVLGNHDAAVAKKVGEKVVTAALAEHSIPLLQNSHLPLERNGSRLWLAGLDDPLAGHPNPDAAIPDSIRHIPDEPVILLCHEPDYVDYLLTHPAGAAVSLMLSGHTHGGQIRLPLIGATALPPLGRKYIEGWFRLDHLQLYVNRGIGTVEVPFRVDCPPEVTLFTLSQD
jgi:uncharacterized protein